jgi:hypothetical protein
VVELVDQGLVVRGRGACEFRIPYERMRVRSCISTRLAAAVGIEPAQDSNRRQAAQDERSATPAYSSTLPELPQVPRPFRAGTRSRQPSR